jgi:hypothetical protein
MSSVQGNVIQSISPFGPAMQPSTLTWTWSLNLRMTASLRNRWGWPRVGREANGGH